MFCSQMQSLAEVNNTNNPPDQLKDHHFFVGVNMSIPHQDAFYPIERVWNARAQIKVNDQIVVEKIDNIKELRYTRQTKISKYFAQINNLKCEPGYSLNRDPQVLSTRTQIALASMASDAMDTSNSALRQYIDHRAEMQGLSESAPSGPAGVEIPTPPDTSREPVELQIQAGQLLEQMEFYQKSDGSENHPWDLLKISFSIKSDNYIPRGHLAFIFQLKNEPESEPVMSWFHFLTLENIAPEEETFDYSLRSFPDGMHVDSQEVFLFSNGSEIATNYSQKHVEMTAKDARVYLNYQYTNRNEGKTQPPQRVWKYLSQNIRSDLHPDLIDEKLTLNIDKEGIVTDVIMSTKMKAALSSKNIHEISSQLYLPALENGEPVPGILDLIMKDVVF